MVRTQQHDYHHECTLDLQWLSRFVQLHNRERETLIGVVVLMMIMMIVIVPCAYRATQLMGDTTQSKEIDLGEDDMWVRRPSPRSLSQQSTKRDDS